MKRTILILSLVISACLLSACEPVTHYNRIRVAGLNGAPVDVPASRRGKVKPYGSVKLFQSKDEVTKPYKLISVMSLEGDAGDEARFITAFLYRAADLGADAIIFSREGVFTEINKKSHGVYRADAIAFEP